MGVSYSAVSGRMSAGAPAKRGHENGSLHRFISRSYALRTLRFELPRTKTLFDYSGLLFAP